MLGIAATLLIASLAPAASAPSLRVAVSARQGFEPVVRAAVTGLHASTRYAVTARTAGGTGCQRVVLGSGRTSASGQLNVALAPAHWCRGQAYELRTAGLTARFVVPPDVPLKGVVVRAPSGAAAAGAHLLLRATSGRTVFAIVTGRSGRFALTAWPGRYRLQPLAFGRLHAPAVTVTLRAGHPVQLRVRYS